MLEVNMLCSWRSVNLCFTLSTFTLICWRLQSWRACLFSGTVQLHRLCGLIVVFSLCLIPCNGGNILVFPLDGSHWVNMKVILEELHSRGHNLTVIRASNTWYIPEKSPLYESITVQIDKSMEEFIDVFMDEHLKAQRKQASFWTFLKLTKLFLSMISEIHEIWADAFVKIIEDPKLFQNILNSKYDLLLTDPGVATGLFLAKFFKLPVVLNVRWIPSGEGHFVLAPSPLSYIPVPGSGLTSKMNFIQRVKNVLFHSIILFQQNIMVQPHYDGISEKYFEGRWDTVSLLQEADIWLFRSDFVFDYPRPTMPNAAYIGGFQCKPAQPLPADLEEFVQSAGEHGVIIMSLGTFINSLPQDATDVVASVFAKLPQKVIWRHVGKRPSTLGNNTLLVDWMPQKDLLGHPQIKLFVAHGGTNGVQEAIYHGVPVLGIPLFFDQYDNLLRLQDRGAAKIIQLSELNADSFERGIQEVLHTDSYRLNIQRMSRLHKDKPVAPMDQAIFWIEYVIRHKGAPHLRTEAYRMPWYSYHSFDVLLFVLTVLTLMIVSTVAVFRFLCCRRRKNSKAKQN